MGKKFIKLFAENFTLLIIVIVPALLLNALAESLFVKYFGTSTKLYQATRDLMPLIITILGVAAVYLYRRMEAKHGRE